MSDFVANIQARLGIIAKMIATTTGAERRKFQRERADLEEKLRKATA